MNNYSFDILVLCADDSTVEGINGIFINTLNYIFDENDVDIEDINYTYIGLDLTIDDENIINADIINFDFENYFGEDVFDMIIFEFCPIKSRLTILSDNLFNQLKYILVSGGYIIDMFKEYKTIYDSEYDIYKDYDYEEYLNFLSSYNIEVENVINVEGRLDILVLKSY